MSYFLDSFQEKQEIRIFRNMWFQPKQQVLILFCATKSIYLLHPCPHHPLLKLLIEVLTEW